MSQDYLLELDDLIKQLKNHSNNPKKSVYLLPNLLTTGTIFFGLFAIISGMNGNYSHAALGIFIAMVMDGLDGRVARLTGTQSSFGAEYDSLSDLVAFGVAPALLIYLWTLSSFGKLGWIAIFFFTVCGALRLARFNVQSSDSQKDNSHFNGLPIPSAAAIIAGLVWVGSEYNIANSSLLGYVSLGLTVTLAALMVSNIKYPSFKGVEFGSMPFTATLVIVGLFSLVAVDPAKVLFSIFFLYGLSGPLFALITPKKSKAKVHSLSSVRKIRKRV